MNIKSKINNLLELALKYADLGWYIHPLDGKRPLLKDWPNKATTDKEIIKSWFTRQYQACNIGIVTGKKSGIFVLDIDRNHGGLESLESLETAQGPLPLTVIANTGGGGKHIVFNHPGCSMSNSASILAPGIDIKADNGQIVASPSIHPVTTLPYSWVEGHSPWDIAVADAPDWLLKLVTQPSAKIVVSSQGGFGIGSRNNSLTSLAGSMRSRGMSENAILAGLREENKISCMPPLPDDEVVTIAHSVSRYAAQYDVKNTPWLIENKVNPAILAECILRLEYFTFHHGQVYIYQDGVYKPESEVLIKRRAQELLKSKYMDRIGIEVIKYIQTKLYSTEAVLDKNINIINLQNGLLEWSGENISISPHTPDHKSSIRIPVIYDSNAKCPKIDKFLKEVLPADCQDLIDQIMGYLLIPDIRYEKAFLLTGAGANGKSTLLKLLTALIGKENISNESLQMLTNNRFRSAELAGKLANLFADLSPEALKDSSNFKMLVSGDDMSAERKNQPPFTFVNTARGIFSANQLPRVLDNSVAFFRRLLIIPFRKSFIGKATKKDPHLIEKLTTQDELSGLLNRGLRGLRLLFQNNEFPIPVSVANELEAYQLDNNNAQRFFKECCIAGGRSRISKQLLYERYIEWCDSSGLRGLSNVNFYKKILEGNPTVTEGRFRGRHCFIGVKFDLYKNQEDDNLDPYLESDGEEADQVPIIPSPEVAPVITPQRFSAFIEEDQYDVNDDRCEQAEKQYYEDCHYDKPIKKY